MSRRRLLFLGAFLPLAVFMAGCDNSVPEEVMAEPKKKKEDDYNYHKKYPWGQGSDPMSGGSDARSHDSAPSRPSRHH
jgi:hypothetical protein